MRKNLADRRKEKGYTQKELAERLSITERHYRMLEAGTSNGTVPLWPILKELLGAPSIDFLLQQEVTTDIISQA